MAGKPKKHLVDGEWITVQEAADRLGLRRQQLYSLTHHKRCSLQVAVNLYRENLAMHDQGRAYRHMVDGCWMTVRQAAEILGVTVTALRSYLYSHRQPDGRPATLAEAVDVYRSGAVRHGGHPPRLHRVGRRMMTQAEAAEMLGINVNTVQCHMSKHKATLAQTIKYYETKQRRRAEKDILNILGF
jgi:predicted transcriptional regulator